MRFTKKLLGSFAALVFAGACADMGSSSSRLSGGSNDGGAQAGDCTLTQGYWKNHEESWPVSSLELGNKTYSKEALLGILRTPVRGNGLISLAHQLIAAKLNIAAGADDADIASVIAAADAKIGDLEVGIDVIATKDVSDLVDDLDAFNNGKSGPGHCDDAPNPPTPPHEDDDDDDDCEHDSDGDGHCDGEDDDDEHECDGDDDGDGTCDHDCPTEPEPEPVPVCGNGVIEAGEECDDGNLVNGDSCSTACLCICPTH